MTPRAGKPVEINALWVNELAAIAVWPWLIGPYVEAAHRTGSDAERFELLRARRLASR